MLPRKNDEDRRIRRTKQNLRKSFIHLMQRKMYHRITVTDIVEHADYNRTTFYRHFQDKEQLVEELVEDMIHGLINAFRYPYKDSKYVRLDALTPSNVIIFNYIFDNQDVFKLWKKQEGIPAFQEKFIETMIYLFEEDINHVSVGSSSSTDSDLFGIYRAYGVWGLIVNWIKSDFAASSEYMAKQLIEIISHRPLQMYEVKQSDEATVYYQ